MDGYPTAELIISVHVFEKRGQVRVPCEKLVVPAKGYHAATTLAQVAATYDVPVEHDVRVSLTKLDVWDAKATPR